MNGQVKDSAENPEGQSEARGPGHSNAGHEHEACGHEHQHHHHHDHESEYCFEFDSTKYETRLHFVTPEQIREIVKLPAGTAIVEILEDGQQKTLREGEEIQLHHCSKFRKLPRFTRGRGGLDADLAAVKREFPGMVLGPNNEYFILPGISLPELFTQQTTDLLVVIAPTYPAAPPANFYVTWGLALKTGAVINNYSGPANLYGRQWGTFSHSVPTDSWNGERDTFLNFIATAIARLQEGA